MRNVLVALLATMVACKSGSKSAEQKAAGSGAGSSVTEPAAPTGKPTVVQVTDQRAVATYIGQLPPLVVIDDAGKLHVAAVKSFEELAKRDPLVGAKPATSAEHLAMFVRETLTLQEPVEAAVKRFDSNEYAKELAKLRDLGQDDPPPPEEEDMPEDGADESGGTGTAMVLEEGKMGSGRAEGQYRMKKIPSDEEVMGFPGTQNPVSDPDVPRATRAANVRGEVAEELRDQYAIIVTSPKAKATALVEVIEKTLGVIAVAHGPTVHPLRLRFFARSYDRHWGGPNPTWVEARISSSVVTIQALPDASVEVAWASGPLDAAKLTATLEQVRTTRGLDPRAPVDVLVDADIDAQRFIDVVAALEIAGVRMIGVGVTPKGAQLDLRTKRAVPTPPPSAQKKKP